MSKYNTFFRQKLCENWEIPDNCMLNSKHIHEDLINFNWNYRKGSLSGHTPFRGCTVLSLKRNAIRNLQRALLPLERAGFIQYWAKDTDGRWLQKRSLFYNEASTQNSFDENANEGHLKMYIEHGQTSTKELFDKNR